MCKYVQFKMLEVLGEEVFSEELSLHETLEAIEVERDASTLTSCGS